ncbi:MAG: glycosyltransferase family 4 protein [Chloroflexi bacterium]|nr:glycosyltransferase family 4 protein [Chloroflexota bacterium]
MRLLLFTQYYPPEVGATQTRAYEMCRYLVSQGHQVTVITEVPNHPSGVIPPAYTGKISERRTEEGIDVLRLWVWASAEKSFKSRMRFYLSYMAMAALAGTLLRGKYDAIYATSPPLFVGAAGVAVALLRRIPFVFEVRDLWPESAVALGELSSPKAIRAAEKLEGFLYSRARRIVVVTEGIRRELWERGISTNKLALIPNGANTDLFLPDLSGAGELRAQLGLQDNYVVMYAGIHGIAQGLESLLDAAHLLKNRRDIEFLFVGEGPKKAELIARKEALGLENVRFLPEVPSCKMPAYLSAADCMIVPLRAEPLFRGALPSKLFEAWACERPVVLSVAGEAEAVMKEANAGLAARPENAADIAEAIERLEANREEAAKMGKRGRAYVIEHFSRQEQTRKVEAVLKEALGKGK